MVDDGREGQPGDRRRDDRHPEPHLGGDLAAAEHEVGQTHRPGRADRHVGVVGAPPLTGGVDRRLGPQRLS